MRHREWKVNHLSSVGHKGKEKSWSAVKALTEPCKKLLLATRSRANLLSPILIFTHYRVGSSNKALSLSRKRINSFAYDSALKQADSNLANWTFNCTPASSRDRRCWLKRGRPLPVLCMHNLSLFAVTIRFLKIVWFCRREFSGRELLFQWSFIQIY